MLLHHIGHKNMVYVIRLCRLGVLRLLSRDRSALNGHRLWSVNHGQLFFLNVKVYGDFLLRLESLFLSRHLHISDFKFWCDYLLSSSCILVERIQKRLVCFHLIVKNKTPRGDLAHCDLRCFKR